MSAASTATPAMIRVQLPDGSTREVPQGTTPHDIATAISPRLAAVVVVARIRPLAGLDINLAEGGEDNAPADPKDSPETMYGAGDPQAEKLVDLSTPLTEDVELTLLKEAGRSLPQSPPPLHRPRHGHRHPRALPRNQAGPRPRHRLRLLLRRLPRDPLLRARSSRHRSPAWPKSSPATTLSSASPNPAS